jgi:hypothetical protein
LDGFLTRIRDGECPARGVRRIHANAGPPMSNSAHRAPSPTAILPRIPPIGTGEHHEHGSAPHTPMGPRNHDGADDTPVAAPINSEQSLGSCLHQWLHRPVNTILGSRRIFSGFIRVSGDGTRIIPRAAMALLSHGCVRLWRSLPVMVKRMQRVGRSRLGPLCRGGRR